VCRDAADEYSGPNCGLLGCRGLSILLETSGPRICACLSYKEGSHELLFVSIMRL
jgi:hypothetical protein